jgi:hypothetical protein
VTRRVVSLFGRHLAGGTPPAPGLDALTDRERGMLGWVVTRGMVAIAAGRGPHTQLNDTYHRVMVVVLGAGLILLLTRPGRTLLDERKPAPDPTR